MELLGLRKKMIKEGAEDQTYCACEKCGKTISGKEIHIRSNNIPYCSECFEPDPRADIGNRIKSLIDNTELSKENAHLRELLKWCWGLLLLDDIPCPESLGNGHP